MSEDAAALSIALVEQLVRNGTLNEDDIAAISDRLTEEHHATAAHWAKVALIQAHAQPAAEWRADQARSRFRVVDGGNDGPT